MPSERIEVDARELLARFPAARMTAWVNAQVALGKRPPGSPGGQRQEDFLEAEFRRLGLSRVRRELVRDPVTLPPQVRGQTPPGRSPDVSHPVQWDHMDEDASGIWLRDGDGVTRLASFPIPHAALTPREGIIAPLAWVDPARRHGDFVPEWAGKIVVAKIRFPALPTEKLMTLALGVYDPDGTLPEMNHPATWILQGWEHYHTAARSGAAAFVGILADQPGGDHRLYAPYGFKERDILDRPIPGLWVGRRDGARLRERAATGALARVSAVAHARERVPAHNIVGEIDGSGTDDEVILVTSHADAPFRSPVEDASGVAVLLALAAHFAEEKAQGRGLRRRLVFLLTAGHFYGSVGTRSFIAAHPELVKPLPGRERPRAVLQITVEHVAREAVEKPGGEGLMLSAHGRRASHHPLRDVALPEAYRPEPAAVFLSYNRALRDAVLEGVTAFDLDRTVLLGGEGPLGPFPPTDGGDWYAAGIPTVNYISNPVYLLTEAGDDEAWVAHERMPRVAAAFAHVLKRLDPVNAARLHAFDLPWGYAKAKVATWLGAQRTAWRPGSP